MKPPIPVVRLLSTALPCPHVIKSSIYKFFFEFCFPAGSLDDTSRNPAGLHHCLERALSLDAQEPEMRDVPVGAYFSKPARHPHTTHTTITVTNTHSIIHPPQTEQHRLLPTPKILVPPQMEHPSAIWGFGKFPPLGSFRSSSVEQMVNNCPCRGTALVGWLSVGPRVQIKHQGPLFKTCGRTSLMVQ